MIEREKKASAYYFVTYTNYNDSIAAGTNSQRAYLSFPWTMHELLCQIKAKSLEASVTEHPAHSHMEKVGRALINANPNTQQPKMFFPHLILQWMKDMPQFPVTTCCVIMSFCNTDHKFIEVSQSDELRENRIGKQFLMLIDFLSAPKKDKPELQLIANEFLLKFHRISVEG
jgi:hypothetical protein